MRFLLKKVSHPTYLDMLQSGNLLCAEKYAYMFYRVFSPFSQKTLCKYTLCTNLRIIKLNSSVLVTVWRVVIEKGVTGVPTK